MPRHPQLRIAMPGLSLLLMVGGFSCGGGGGTATAGPGPAPAPAPAPNPAPAPWIGSFDPAKETLTLGESTTLTPIFANGIGTIDNSVGQAATRVPLTVSPLATTTYTLTVSNGQTTAVKSATITVVPSPVITDFKAVPSSMVSGETGWLLSRFTGGTGTITPGDLTVNSGSLMGVAPTVTTTYTLTVTNPAGASTTQVATLTVRPTNASPTFLSTPPTTNGTSSQYQYSVVTNDTDGQAVALGLVTAPAGATLSGNTVQWTITKDQERKPASFLVRATDAMGATSDQAWTVNATGTITGTKATTYHTTAGTQMVPKNLATTPIAAWVADGSGGFFKRTGVGAADGTFSISGVPEGNYQLQLGASRFYVMSASVLDMGDDAWGRPDRLPVTLDPTNLMLNLSNLAPWQSEASIPMQWFDDMTETTAPIQAGDFTSGSPVGGDTALSSATLNLKTFASWGDPVFLVDTTKGDHPYLSQMVSRSLPASTLTYQTPSRSFQPSPLTQVDGGTSALTGAFTTVPLSNTFPYFLKGSDFSALKTAVHPLAESLYSEFVMGVNPAGALGKITTTPDVIMMDTTSLGDADLNLGNLTFANPYPASWPLLWVQSYGFGVTYGLPGVSSQIMNGYLFVTSASMPSAEAPIRAVLAPVQGVQVSGQPLTAPVAGVGLTPTITWLAPAIGTSTHSLVYVYRLFKNGSSLAAFEQVGEWTTTGTSIQIPPGVLVSGETYFMKISTMHKSGYQEPSPFRSNPTDWALADCLTFTFKP